MKREPYITRLPNGWQVRFRVNGFPHQRYFGDLGHGGRKQSLMAAREWRDRERTRALQHAAPDISKETPSISRIVSPKTARAEVSRFAAAGDFHLIMIGPGEGKHYLVSRSTKPNLPKYRGGEISFPAGNIEVPLGADVDTPDTE